MLNQHKPVRLVLENGIVFHGKSFGAHKKSSGELIFNTSMVGYPESLTDPSNKGQILTLTYPIIGNYGVPADGMANGISDFFESEHIHVKGLIVQDYCHEFSHWNAQKSLSDWLVEHDVPGIYGIDTRMLTKILREEGNMLGKIVYDDTDDIPFYDPATENLVAQVSCTEVIEYGSGDKTVVLVDCGVKHAIIRELVKCGVKVVRVPWNYDFNTLDYDGLFISNGPGNPDHCQITVDHLTTALQSKKPIFGICMGNQLLAKAAGAKIYKLKYGHRGGNQPVRKVGTNTCFVTSQNHGYAIDETNLGADWEPYFVNMNDGTNEGIRHKSLPFYSVQFHPEACNGPTDTVFFFDEFVRSL